MWYSIKSYITDRWIFIPFGLALAVCIAMLLYGFSHIHRVHDQVLLRYTILVGPSLRGEWWRLYYTPMYAAIALLLHIGAGVLVYKKDKMCARIFAVSSVIFQVFVFIAFVLLIGINF